MLQDFVQQFWQGLLQTKAWEIIAVVSGIASVWFSKRESIWVYPVGLIGTIIYTWLSFTNHLIGEAAVNFYYTVMSLYGWALWARRDAQQQKILHITYSTKTEWAQLLLASAVLYMILFLSLRYLKQAFYPGVIPWGDAFASATAFTGMWLMARKKVESWWLWIATNIASVPLYFVKGLVVTSVYYFILLILAVMGLREWQQRAATNKTA